MFEEPSSPPIRSGTNSPAHALPPRGQAAEAKPLQVSPKETFREALAQPDKPANLIDIPTLLLALEADFKLHQPLDAAAPQGQD